MAEGALLPSLDAARLAPGTSMCTLRPAASYPRDPAELCGRAGKRALPRWPALPRPLARGEGGAEGERCARLPLPLATYDGSVPGTERAEWARARLCARDVARSGDVMPTEMR